MMDWLRANQKIRSEKRCIEIAGRTLPITIKRHRTAKRLIMRLAPDGSELRVTMPRWGQSVDALEFAESRRSWIAAQLDKVEEARPPRPDGQIDFIGEPVTIAWDPQAPRKPRLLETTLHIGGPEDSLRSRIERWLRDEALAIMDRDLAEYCALAEVTKPDLKLSRAQRRWGSCSSSGTVRINWRLIMAPADVRRSVVAHEVAHLLHFDHGPAFYAALDRIFEGDIDAANAWLKAKGRALYGPFG
ncbi:SprT family zinc-dependent metalloprotease [Pontixanthobacter sp. CEM42]|uniref:M48 family metallopeptidase n=1 Tax=Pontixanthobacter sp. CEM42 TaxID=2792077 RepID=UPI001AE0BC13|nr:SprT family zinc-dependent metalloprotease [Pontixanthobacter sp. CEM42]